MMRRDLCKECNHVCVLQDIFLFCVFVFVKLVLHVGLFQVEGMEGSMGIANACMGTHGIVVGSVGGRDGWRLGDRGWRKPSDQS